MKRAQFRLDLRCPHCDAAGAATWEENALASPKGMQRRLVELQGPFHSESGRTRSGDPLIVCTTCDTIQDD